MHLLHRLLNHLKRLARWHQGMLHHPLYLATMQVLAATLLGQLDLSRLRDWFRYNHSAAW